MIGGVSGWEWGVAGGAIGATMLVKAYDWWTTRQRDRTENNANVTLVAGLTERIEKLEARLAFIENDNSRLRSLLYDEQARSARLGLRVIALEQEIVRLGGSVPAHPEAPPAPAP